jgi:ABC-type branched-subunit amino acid transport system substrate-binding protein
MSLTPFDTSYNSTPQIYQSVQASAAEINKNGGINGHPIQVIVCNDQNDPNSAASCAQEAVSDNVAAVVGAASLENTSSVIEVLAQANIPEIAPEVLGSGELTSTDAFVIQGDQPALFAGCGWVVAKAGARQIKTVQTDVAAAAAQVPFVNMGLKPFSLTASSISIPTNATDFSPYASAALSGGTDGLVPIQDITGAEAFINALLQSNVNFANTRLCAEYDHVPPNMGSSANGLLVASTFPSRTSAGLAPVVSALQAVNKDIPLSDPVFNAWYGTQLFADVARTITGTVDGKSVLKALNTSKPIQLIPGDAPYDPSKAHTGPKGLNNLVSRSVFFSVFQDGKLVPYSTPSIPDAFAPPGE